MAGTMTAALIVTAELGPADLARLDTLRRRHFPPERNQLAAHLTMFHAVPALLEDELKHRLARIASSPPPAATLAGLIDLCGGVAFRVVSEELEAIRDDLGEAFRGSLTQQDSHGWRPHVTIQNKVAPKVARALLAELQLTFEPRALVIAGLAYHYYENGPWRLGQRYAFLGR